LSHRHGVHCKGIHIYGRANGSLAGASQHTELVRAPRHDKKDREQKKQDPHGQRCGENELRASVADWTNFLAPPTALR
jgi:hypothetical protein